MLAASAEAESCRNLAGNRRLRILLSPEASSARSEVSIRQYIFSAMDMLTLTSVKQFQLLHSVRTF